MSETSRILLVDDDEDEVRVALRALDRSGLPIDVDVARNGVEALDRLGLEGDDERTEPLPDVVLLDVKMPLLDGWAVLRRIRDEDRTASVPVVVVTASDRPEDVRRAYAGGANSVLLKRRGPGGPGHYIVEAARYWTRFNRTPGALRWAKERPVT